MMSDYHGSVTVLDDDPSPRMTFRSAGSVVREGGSMTWTVRLEDPVLHFRIPIRYDDRADGEETLTLRALSDTGWRSRRVTVVVRD